MSHLSERTLGLYAIEPALVSGADAAHLAACYECRRALSEVREFDASLREPESWTGVSDAAPRAGNEELRAFAVRSAEEDEEALQLLEEFREPSAAARFVWAKIATKPEYQTGGVARLLSKWANGMCERDPLYALKLAEAATTISQLLPDQNYPRNTIHELRGEALKEQANALLFLGRLHDALNAIAAAEVEYRKLAHESIGLAAVKYLRGAVHYEQEELDAAERDAYESAEVSLRLGATDSYMNARHLLGYVLFDRHQYADAAEVYADVLRCGQAKGSGPWIARESLAVGGCYLELGRLSEADRYLHEALRLFISLGFPADITRTQWAIGRLIFAQGNASEAIYRLRRCIRELTDYQIITDAALVAIDLAEILNASGRPGEISKVLANVVQTFMDAGKLTGALTALGYLKDAAAGGKLTPGVVAYVRRFVQRADRRPELFFAPPPDPL